MREILEKGVVVGATMGMIPPPPGLTSPPAVLARTPRIIANTQRMVTLDARIVAGTDAGIAPVKPPDVLRDDLGRGHGGRARPLQGPGQPGYDADLLVLDVDPLADPHGLHAIRDVYRAGAKGRPRRAPAAPPTTAAGPHGAPSPHVRLPDHH